MAVMQESDFRIVKSGYFGNGLFFWDRKGVLSVMYFLP